MKIRIVSAILAAFCVFFIFPPGNAQQPQTAQPPQSLRLYVFDCGSLNIPDISPYQFKKDPAFYN
jgi:hypothetical protein